MRKVRLFAGLSVSIMMIASILQFASCNFDLESAANARKATVTVSISGAGREPRSVDGGSVAHGRALSANAGFLYLQAGITAETAKLYGPYPVSAGATVTITDLDAGTYPAISLLFVADLPSSPLSPIIPETQSAEGMRLATQTALADSPGVRDAASVGYVADFTVVWGKNNAIKASLVPLTALEPNTDGFVDIAGLPSGVTRRFVKVSGLLSKFPTDGAGMVRALRMTVRNTDAYPVTVSGIGLYDASGRFVARENPAASLLNGESVSRSVEWTGDDEYYAYVEFSGLNVSCSFLPTLTMIRTVTFNANGGTGSMASRSVLEGSSIALPENGFSNTGSTFLGWATIPDATVPEFYPGDSFTVGDGDPVFYAIWAAPSTVRTITYDGNGGSGSMNAQSGPSGATIALAANGFNRSGYTFQGWSALSAATTPEYPAGYPYTLGAGNVTLYAIWRDQTAPTIVTPAFQSQYSNTILATNALMTVSELGRGIRSIIVSGAASFTSPKILIGASILTPTVSGSTLTLTDPVTVSGTIAISGINLPAGDGSKTVTFTITDDEGNASGEASAQITLDMTKPTLTITPESFTYVLGGTVMNGSTVYTTGAGTLYCNSSDTGSDINGSSAAGWNVAGTPATYQTAGASWISVSDRAGNVTTINFTTVLDVSPPSVDNVTVDGTLYVSGGHATLTAGNTYSLSVSANDQTGVVEYSLDGTVFQASPVFDVLISTGDTYYFVYVRDALGNTSGAGGFQLAVTGQ